MNVIRMIFQVSKIGAAVDQLDWAIKLFLDESAFVPAITLAGASEEILGEVLGDSAAFRQMLKSFEGEYDLSGSIISQQHLNRVKNWLKHWKGMNDNETTEIELETEAIQYITRAITNLYAHDRTLSSETPRFLHWLAENKSELLRDI